MKQAQGLPNGAVVVVLQKCTHGISNVAAGTAGKVTGQLSSGRVAARRRRACSRATTPHSSSTRCTQLHMPTEGRCAVHSAPPPGVKPGAGSGGACGACGLWLAGPAAVVRVVAQPCGTWHAGAAEIYEQEQPPRAAGTPPQAAHLPSRTIPSSRPLALGRFIGAGSLPLAVGLFETADAVEGNLSVDHGECVPHIVIARPSKEVHVVTVLIFPQHCCLECVQGKYIECAAIFLNVVRGCHRCLIRSIEQQLVRKQHAPIVAVRSSKAPW